MAPVTSFLQILCLLLPAVMSVLAVVLDIPLLTAGAALALLVLVCTLPLCRGDEIPWSVLLAVPTGFPVNLLLVQSLRMLLWTDAPGWAQVLRSLLALYVLFSVETIVLSLLVSLFRRR